MDAKEAEKLSKDKRVLRVEQDRTLVAMTTQMTPGWGLDRLDSATPALNSAYSYTNTGAGQTIYILDSGLDLSNPTVAAEFGGRASIIYDYNGGTGYDCHGHGTGVASIAAGNTYGVAKGANVVIARITIGCTDTMDLTTSINAFNWLAAYAPAGTIVNLSFGLTAGGVCSIPGSSPTLENAIIAAHKKGIIVVVAAGNDGCDTANYSPTNITQSFVVGATHHGGLPGQDRKWVGSRTGLNISTFAPGFMVPMMNMNGGATVESGTSFAAPYVAGIFAVACQAYAPFCNSGNTTTIYDALRSFATWNTVTNNDGTPLTGAYSRFIRQQW